MNVLALGALTFALAVAFGTVASPHSSAAPEQSTDPWEGSTFTAPSSYSTSTDAVFSGVFKHTPPAPISSVVLHLQYSAMDTPSAGCPAPSDQTYVPPDTTPSTTTSTTIDPSTSTSIDPSTTTTQPPPSSSTVKFEFHVPFTCNGIYDASATASIEDPTGETAPPLHKTVDVVAVHIAVPPDAPASITATDKGNHTVAVSWAAPKAYAGAGPPPDFTGYRLSRKDGAGGSFAAIGGTPATTLTFVDSSIPPSGGSFAYEVESVRKFATSTPVATDGALTIGGAGASPSASGGGRSGGSRAAPDPGAGGTGTAYYDTTLADEGDEPGGNALSGVPGGGAIQRFGGRSGAGLVKPFAAAMNLGVWAALVLFLTRRAAKAERAALLGVDLEHAP